MNILSHIKMYRWKCFALFAAMVFTVAASGVSQCDGALTAAAEDAAPAEESSEVLDPGLEDLIMYRWERVTWENYNRLVVDGKDHLSLLINESGCVLNGTLEKNVVRGADSPSLPGLQHTNVITTGHALFDRNSELDNNVAIQQSHYIYCDTVARFNDSQIDPNAEVFYTDTDRSALVIRYCDKNEYIEADGVQVPKFHIGLHGGGDLYWLYGHDYSSSSCLQLDKAKGDADNQWTFEPTSSRQWWKIRMYDRHNDDEWLMCRHDGSSGYFWFSADGDRQSSDDCRWYVGERMRFSKIKGSRRIQKGQVLPIGSGTFVQDDNTIADTNGVVLMNGATITVNEGGILSISGAFLNNGTIINNGGTILVKNGGSISPFQQGSDPLKNGCGKIICNDGDIIVQQGGAIYGGLYDESGAAVELALNGRSTLINQGLLVYGSMTLGHSARVELYETSHTYGSIANLYLDMEDKGGQRVPGLRARKEINLLFMYNQDVIKNDGTFGTYEPISQEWAKLIAPIISLKPGMSYASAPVPVVAAKGAVFSDSSLTTNQITVGDLTL